MPRSERFKDDELFKRLQAAMRRAEARDLKVPPVDVDAADEASRLLAAENKQLRTALARAEQELSESRKSVINLMMRLANERRRWKAAMLAVHRRLKRLRARRDAGK